MARSSRDKNFEFINELLTEMVHNRCFCEPGSREFVEFDSVRIKPLLNFPNKIQVSEIYAAELTVRFSGDPRTFKIVIKLLPEKNDVANAFELFQNEELFYTKISPIIGTENFPKCYVADLGRYGRPVIVLENLEAQGYIETEEKLDEEHLKIWIKAIGKFHGKGLRMKSKRPEEFREFYAKLQESTFTEKNRNDMPNVFLKTSPFRGLKYLKSINNPEDDKLIINVESKLGKNPYEITENLATEISEYSSICHGDLSRNNLLFKYNDEGKPVDVKIIDWQTTRYCPVGIDLGPIIFTNLESEDLVSKVNRLLEIYSNSLQIEAPDILINESRKDVVRKFIFGYNVASFCVPYVDEDLVSLQQKKDTLEEFVQAVCSLGGRDADEELANILHDLNKLGTFD